uniref:Uncharacterized protein n=1 Tax=Myotis myotis TaxID=51298 RepID=A0A7J7U583_MYOMY|nr:hypothetical protein mMyoMyo1_008875 [Myotis myotis]
MRVAPGNPGHLGGLQPRGALAAAPPRGALEASLDIWCSETHRAHSGEPPHPPARGLGEPGSRCCDGIDRAWEGGSPAVSKGTRWSWPRLRGSCKIPWTASSTGGPRRPGGGRVWKWLRAQPALASDSGSATCWLRGLSKLLFIHPLGSGWTSEGPWGAAWVAVCAKTSTGWTCTSAMTEGSPAPE